LFVSKGGAWAYTQGKQIMLQDTHMAGTLSDSNTNVTNAVLRRTTFKT